MPPSTPTNAGGEVYPGQPGLVVTDTAARAMVWGFPLGRRGRSGERLKPRFINNARDDRLDSPFWRSSLVHRRCLVPISAFAEAAGEPGHKTRTWISHPAGDLLAGAGIWRESEEWGACFSLVMTRANAQLSSVHDRMPVLLHPRDWHDWLRAPADDARRLCLPYDGDLRVEKTSQRWNSRRPPSSA
nr:SOS response-associated peptidase family protein [Qipengyuania thermophila]